MIWGIIHRKILLELLKIFALALISLTGLIVMAGVISEAMKNGLGPTQILGIIPLLLPSLLPYTVPTTTLFTTCIVYGRLSADNEILALKAAGVHIIHIVWPALLLGLVTGAVTMFFFLDLIPRTGSMLRNQVMSDVEELLYTMLRKDGYIRHPKINFEIFVKNVVGRKLIDAQFMRRAADGQGFDVVLRCKEAEMRVDIAHNLILVDMRQCHIYERNGAVGFVESRIWPVEINGGFADTGPKFRSMDMTWLELFEYYDRFHKEKQRISLEINTRQTELNLRARTQEDEDFIRRLSDERKIRDYQIFSIQTEWQLRPALSFGCFCFALVGCPIGIWFSKSDYLSAFITCFLPIVTIYYPVMFCMLNMSCAGKLPPWMAIWNADALLLAAGLVLFWRLAKN